MKKLYFFLKSFKTAADLKDAQMSLYDYQSLIKIFNDCKKYKKSYFINETAFKILMQLDCFKVKISGFGWTATPKK